jgi:hypothetical protein
MSRLNTFTLQSPGTLGLNTQDQDTVQDPRYATQALNCVISRNGLLESRKGAQKANATAATGTPTLDVVYSYMEDDGTENIISTGGNKIWVGTSTLTDKTGALTVTDDNWQFQNYAGEVFGYNGTNPPIYWDGGAGAFLTIASKGTAAGVVSSGVHLSAFGRSWVVDTTSTSTINYSDLLIPEDFTGGSSGTIDLNSVWTHSNDTIVALAVHNNNLVIFCERSIVIYGSADNINNLYLVEVISSNGCIARDSVQTVGNDIFYLANDGVRSLSRTVLQDNMPMGQISAPIRDEMIDAINSATLTTVRSTYNEQQGFYLIQLGEVTYCCDVRLAEQGVFRWTKWDLPCYGLATSNSTDDALYFGMAAGFLATYDEYLDLTDTYVMKYRSGWVDVGVQTSKCLWKRALWYIASLANIQATTTWAFDFNETENSQSKSLIGSPAPVYGTAVYGTASFGGNYEKQQLSYQLTKTGSIIRLGFQSVVNGGKFAFNKIDLFFKTGHIR